MTVWSESTNRRIVRGIQMTVNSADRFFRSVSVKPINGKPDSSMPGSAVYVFLPVKVQRHE